MVLQSIKYQPASSTSSPTLDILDQLLLPHQSVYIPIRTCEDAFMAIKQMQVRGAPAIAIVAALAIAVEIGHDVQQQKTPERAEDMREHIAKRLEYLKTSRPTAVNLSDAIGKLKIVVKKASLQSNATSKRVAEQYTSAAEHMLIADVADNKAIGAHGAKWIAGNTVAGKERKSRSGELKILTHCNTGSLATAGYGTALGVIRALKEQDLLTHAYCSETRPYNQGSRLTAYELVHDQIPATLITDSMAASLMASEGRNLAAIVVGADRVAANGDTANKIGTYSLAVLAKHHNVRFLVAAPRTTIDLATSTGSDIVIEQRAGEEVTRVRGQIVTPSGKVNPHEAHTVSTAALGIQVWNPAFDVTPADLIDGVITEVGVVEKKDGRFDFRAIFDQTPPSGTEIKPSTTGNP